jgi:hypothetical protein
VTGVELGVSTKTKGTCNENLSDVEILLPASGSRRAEYPEELDKRNPPSPQAY